MLVLPYGVRVQVATTQRFTIKTIVTLYKMKLIISQFTDIQI